MDFEVKVTNILSEELSTGNKVISLADLLIPRIMYIPFAKISCIKVKIEAFESTSDICDNGLYLTNVIQSFLTYRQEKYQESLSKLNKEWPFKNEEIEPELIAANSIIKGTNFRSLGNREGALTAFHHGIQQFSEIPSQPFQEYLYALASYHIAEINAELENYEVMLEKHKNFLILSKEIGNVDMVNRALNGMGRAYLELKDYRNALKLLQAAEKNAKKAANIPFKAKNLHDIGRAYYNMGSYENALVYLEKALSVRENHQLIDASVTTYILMAKVHVASEDYKSALTTLHKGLAKSENLKTQKKTCTIFKLLSSVYEKNQQFKEALEFHKKFHKTKELLEDIKSTQKESERVRETNTQLHQQKNIISQQKQQIETYAAKLTDSNKLLQNFAYIAAHDLKAPIKVTGSFIDLIQKKNQSNWDESDKQYFSFVNQNMLKLSKMIDNLLSLSRLDQALPPLEIVHTDKLLQEIQNRLQKKIQNLKPEIIIQKDLPNLLGHESLIGQIFQNLIDNALKYRSELTPIIEVSSSIVNLANKKQYIQFKIKDNGKGIPVSFQGKIFDLFSGTNQKDSNGIGLATCKKIISNYGGNIWVESKVGQGTTMNFTLMAAQ